MKTSLEEMSKHPFIRRVDQMVMVVARKEFAKVLGSGLISQAVGVYARHKRTAFEALGDEAQISSFV